MGNVQFEFFRSLLLALIEFLFWVEGGFGGGETGHQAESFTKFWDFLEDFIRYLLGQRVYAMFIINNHASFHFW